MCCGGGKGRRIRGEREEDGGMERERGEIEGEEEKRTMKEEA